MKSNINKSIYKSIAKARGRQHVWLAGKIQRALPSACTKDVIGFGWIRIKEKENACVLAFHTKEGVKRVVSLINSYLRTPKIDKFNELIDCINQRENLSINKYSEKTDDLDSDGWLAPSGLLIRWGTNLGGLAGFIGAAVKLLFIPFLYKVKYLLPIVFFACFEGSEISNLCLMYPLAISKVKPKKASINSKLDKGACKDLVVWGTNLGSTVGYGRLTKVTRNLIKIPPFHYSVMVGLLLSDGWLIFSSSKNKNARLGFKQSLDRSTYVLHVFNILSHYCNSAPHSVTNRRAGKINYGLEIFTRALPCFTELHYLFYPQGIKVIPSNIYDLLTPVAFAHLIMGDGSTRPTGGIMLHTNSFSIKDVVMLMNVIIIKFRLECTMHMNYGAPKIFIPERSSVFLVPLIKPYMIPSLYYKLGIRPHRDLKYYLNLGNSLPKRKLASPSLEKMVLGREGMHFLPSLVEESAPPARLVFFI